VLKGEFGPRLLVVVVCELGKVIINCEIVVEGKKVTLINKVGVAGNFSHLFRICCSRMKYAGTLFSIRKLKFIKHQMSSNRLLVIGSRHLYPL